MSPANTAAPPAPARPASPVAGSSSDPRIGSRLGKYLIRAQLGQGGMGVVYEAEDELLQRRVAVKLLPPALAADKESLHLFLREARSAARLSHANAVGIHEIDCRDGTWFIVMELVRGGSAADYIRARGPFSWPEATRIAADACRGLAAAHEVGIVHRDIKPANIMRAKSDGTVKVADFGLAKTADRPDPAGTGAAASGVRLFTSGGVPIPSEVSMTARTAAGSTVVGTPQYMSPEQCRGLSTDARSDIYSMGATFFALLTGKTPFGDAGEVVDVLTAHCVKAPPDPRKFRPDIPEACVAVINKALAKDPADRYRNAREMLAALEGLLARPAVTAGAGGIDTGSSHGVSADWARFLDAQNGRTTLSIGAAGKGLIVNTVTGRLESRGGSTKGLVLSAAAALVAITAVVSVWRAVQSAGSAPTAPKAKDANPAADRVASDPPEPVRKDDDSPWRDPVPVPPVPPGTKSKSPPDRTVATPVLPDLTPVPPLPAGPVGPWPGKSVKGLVWFYDRVGVRSVLPDGRECRLVDHRGPFAGGGRGQLISTGTGMLAPGFDADLLAACKASHELTVEATLTIDNVTQGGPARIITFSRDGMLRNFSLCQEGRELLLRLRTTKAGENGTQPQPRLCWIEKAMKGRPFHLLFSWADGRLRCWVDGKPEEVSDHPQGDLSNWAAMHLVLGDEYSDPRPWEGEIEGVAIWSRAVTDDKEAAERYRLSQERLRRAERGGR